MTRLAPRSVLAAATLALLCLPVASWAGPVVDWFLDIGGEPRKVVSVGSFTPEGPRIIGADPLTYDADYNLPFMPVPQRQAEFVVLLEPDEGAVALAALIFSDMKPACGEEGGTMLVASGTGAFLSEQTANAISAMAEDYGRRDLNLYDNFFADPDQMGDQVFYRLLSLPDGTRFPAVATGWGDGAYPVARLFDDQGQVIAIYADFIGSEKIQDWILPPACAS
ncbi:DUF4241 domain-containing protein [Paracoccus sp. M683]|uniref:DUF4241 domain-containing protein n=1 Tax=Paracoccus sp. M683 TaxID=2594268 RepID=UPI00117E378C|nr:DUF4241 domain-containing protein [Paracoccus sp. M683]TRW99173.1 DUF4241 domain-containing protein [Paracoccus sp. M683]